MDDRAFSQIAVSLSLSGASLCAESYLMILMPKTNAD